jgi:hypothetical protein
VTIEKLSYIHTKSRHHSFAHNIMFDDSFKAAIADKEIRGQALLGIAHSIPVPDFLRDETSFYSRVIRYAISIADKPPYRIYILTSPELEPSYSDNHHYAEDDVKAVEKIRSGSFAEEVIDVVSSVK